MRCAVIAAVLLLVYIQDAAAGAQESVSSMCESKYPAKDCGGGWYRISPKRCAKYLTEEKTFISAEYRCETLAHGSFLVSIHNADENNNVMCLSLRTTKTRNHFWIGGRLEGATIKWEDGSKYDFNRWGANQPDYVWENCVEMNYGDWGRWNNERCNRVRHVVCARNM